MSLVFRKKIHGLSQPMDYSILNKRITCHGTKFLLRADIMVKGTKQSGGQYLYVADTKVMQHMFPVPKVFLRQLFEYDLKYSEFKKECAKFQGVTVIYFHGFGSASEDNSILQASLIEQGANIIRFSYNAHTQVKNPQKNKIAAFINKLEEILPNITKEAKAQLIKIKKEFPELFKGKVVYMGHSFGAAIAADLAVACKTVITPYKYINLDGIIYNPALKQGFKVPQLHLSQDLTVDKTYLTNVIAGMGEDYKNRISTFIKNSGTQAEWEFIKGSTHFTFTDFSSLLKPYKLLTNISGKENVSAIIRKKIINFIFSEQK